MSRSCAFCYNYTFGKNLFCSKCYKKYREEITQAKENNEPWLKELLILTRTEIRRLQRETQMGRITDGEYN